MIHVWFGFCCSLSHSRLLPAQASSPSPRVLEDQDSLDDAFHDFHWFLMMTLWFNCSPVVFPTNLKVSVPIPPLSFHALFVTPRTKFQRILYLSILSLHVTSTNKNQLRCWEARKQQKVKFRNNVDNLRRSVFMAAAVTMLTRLVFIVYWRVKW